MSTRPVLQLVFRFLRPSGNRIALMDDAVRAFNRSNGQIQFVPVRAGAEAAEAGFIHGSTRVVISGERWLPHAFVGMGGRGGQAVAVQQPAVTEVARRVSTWELQLSGRSTGIVMRASAGYDDVTFHVPQTVDDMVRYGMSRDRYDQLAALIRREFSEANGFESVLERTVDVVR